MSEQFVPTSGGPPAYQGYDYQIEVTIWVALQLMLQGTPCSEWIEVEPASEEDVRAKLDVPPEEVVSTLQLPAERELQIQVKLRSRPFSLSDFKSLVSPSVQQKRSKGGPVPRQRPIEYLRTYRDTSYILITSAQVDPKLSRHLIQRLDARPEAAKLPFEASARLKLSAEENASIASRLGILHQQRPEFVHSELRRLLRDVAYVPSGWLEGCHRALREAVRDRLLRRAPGTWTRAELHHLIEQHRGLPRRPHQQFIKPVIYEELLQQLEQRFALLLVGTRGVGKSATADVLAYEHRVRSDPFEVIRSNLSPLEIRSYLERAGRYLFHLEDPWGATSSNSFEATQWVQQLPNLLLRASPDKRFLITSRKGLFKEAFPQQIPSMLQEVAAELLPEHYGDDARWEILMQTLRGHPVQEDFAVAHREAILTTLTVPYSLQVFGQQLRRKESLPKSELKALLRGSMMETLGETVAAEVRTWPTHQAQATILVGFLLQMGKVFTEPDVGQVVESLRGAPLQPPLEFMAALKHLIRAEWVVKRDDAYWAHPQVTEGLTSLFGDAPERTTEILLVWMRGLLKSGQPILALLLSFELGRRNQPVSQDLEEALDAFLIRRALEAEDSAFLQALDSLGHLSRRNAPEAVIARRLVGSVGFPQGGVRWHPSEWAYEDRAEVQASTSARQIVARFIRHGWMKSQMQYSWENFSAWIGELGWSFQKECLEASLAALGEEGWQFVQQLDLGPGLQESFEVALPELLQGALVRPDAPLEEFLGLALDALAKARRFVEEEKEALLETGMSTAAGALRDMVLAALPRPFQRAVQTIVDIRRQREGYAWVRSHPRREEIVPAFNASIQNVIFPFTSSLSPRHLETRPMGTVEEVTALHEASGEDKRSVWNLMRVMKAPEFIPMLLKDLQECPLGHLRLGVQILQRLMDIQEAAQALSSLSGQVDFVRRVALAEAIVGPSRAPLRGLSPEELKIVGFCISTLKTRPPRAEFETLSPEQWPLLRQLAEKHPGLLGVGALLALAFSGEPLERRTDKVGAVSDEHALLMWERFAHEELTRVRPLLRTHLHHGKARFRDLALRLLAPTATAEERAEILQLAEDPSAFVRKTCAVQIGKHGWPEGVKALFGLLTRPPGEEAIDARFSAQSSPVGRAAATALAKMPRLEDVEFRQCLELVRRGPEAIPDPWVRCELVLLVARSALTGCRETLEWCLESPELLPGEQSPRRFPLRYAGAWGLFLHLRHHPEAQSGLNLERLTRAAKHPDARLAGPCLLVLGLVAPRASGSIREVFTASTTTPYRALLVASGAVIGGSPLSEDLLQIKLSEREPGLLLLQRAQQPQPLPAEDWVEFLRQHPEVFNWVTSMRQPVDVHRLLQWTFFELFGRRAREALPLELFQAGPHLSADESLRLIMEMEWRDKDPEWGFW